MATTTEPVWDDEDRYQQWLADNPDPSDDEIDLWYTASGRLRSPATVARMRGARQNAADRAEWERSQGPRKASPRTSRSTRPTRPTKRSRSSSGRRVGSARRSTLPGRSYRRAARQLQAPVEQQFVGGMRVIGLTLSIVALYLVLTNAGPFAGVLGGLNRGLSWLSDPTRSIPYAPGAGG